MMKTTQKAIRDNNFAIDITHASETEINKIELSEKWFNEIAYSAGIYGCNGVLLQGHETGTLYKITCRCTNLFRVH